MIINLEEYRGNNDYAKALIVRSTGDATLEKYTKKEYNYFLLNRYSPFSYHIISTKCYKLPFEESYQHLVPK